MTLRSLAYRLNPTRRETPATVSWRDATVVLVIFTVAQFLDGLLTYWGVSNLGIHVEGNDLLAAGMNAVGPLPALVSAKLLACVCGYVLYRTASHRPLAVMAGLYIGVAITPWLLIISGMLINAY